MYRTLILLFTILFISFSSEAQTADDFFEKGLESFRWQKTDEAAVFFQQAVNADPRRDMLYLYLGISYHEIGRLQDAEDIYSQGINLNGGERDRLLLNRGNLRTIRSDFAGASSDYTQLIDSGGPLSSSALLNRANMELNQSSLVLALDDYSRYLVVEPETPQRETIEELIKLLNIRLTSDAAIAEAAAEQARLEEERRIAEETVRAEEEARRAALMEQVLQSLSNSVDDTKSISAGSDNIRDDLSDSALED